MADERRRRELAKIHLVARRELGMDDDTYRSMLAAVAGVRSAAALDESGRRKVLDHLALQVKTPKQYPGRPHNIASANAPVELRKIEALLTEAQRQWAYADAMAKRMYDVDRVAWCTPDQARGILAALVYDARRHGRRTR